MPPRRVRARASLRVTAARPPTRGPPRRDQPGLGERAEYPQHPCLSVALDVDPCHQAIAEEERKHVVTVNPLRRRGIELDPVAETEEPLGARPGPDQRVEGRQQGARFDARASAPPPRRRRARSSPRLGTASGRRPRPARPRALSTPRAAGGSSRRGRARSRRRGAPPRSAAARDAPRPRSASARRGRPPAAPARAGRSGARSGRDGRRRRGPRRRGSPARSCPRSSSTSGFRAAHRRGDLGRADRAPLATVRRTDSSSSGFSAASRRAGFSVSFSARAIRQRSSGCSSTGSSDASCPQYSNRLRWRPARVAGPAEVSACAARRSRVARG